MGQYFRPIIINEENTDVIASYNTWTKGIGSKLMEHSWMRNDFVRHIESYFMPGGIYYKKRLVWAGDYADNIPLSNINLYIVGRDFETQYIKKHNQTLFEEATKKANTNYYQTIRHIPHLFSEMRENLKKEYANTIETIRQKVEKKYITDVPMPKKVGNVASTKYIINHSKGMYVDKTKISNIDGWQIHPLPLLTAEGNGMGGGDYKGINMDMVGIWRGDIISIENTIPDGFTELKVDFIESRFYRKTH